MNYNEFIDSMVDILKEKLGKNCNIMVKEVPKNNGIWRKGIVIMEDGNLFPTFYMEEAFQQFQNGVPQQQIAGEIISLYESHAHGRNLDISFFFDFSQVEGRIFHKVINYEKNRELLQNVPHLRWNDLAVTFYYRMEEGILERSSITVQNSHLDMWGQSVEEIFRISQRNMKEKMPGHLIPILERQEKGTGGIGVPMYVLTNKEEILGASAMLYSEEIKKLAERLDSDLLILPSSLHEIILLPDNQKEGYSFYREVVSEVNRTQVPAEEILSFNLYRYDRQKEEIELIPL